MEEDLKLKNERIDESNSAQRSSQFWNAIGGFLAAALIVLMVGGVIALFYQRHNATGLYRREYEGRIVEKSLIPHDSQTGSSAERAFLIKGNNGEQFQVIVGRDIYDRAEVGMWVKSDRAGVKLSWP